MLLCKKTKLHFLTRNHQCNLNNQMIRTKAKRENNPLN